MVVAGRHNDEIPFDATPDEVESRAELDAHLGAGSLAGLTVQGIRLDEDYPQALQYVDVTGTLFVGCRFPTREICADLIRRGADVVPAVPDIPYPIQPARLYSADDLAAGFAEGGFAAMYDTVVYQHFRRHGGALPPVREALSQRLHDHGIDNALGNAIDEWARANDGPVVGIMGGHRARRGSPGYRDAAAIGQGLAGAGCLVVTGGGPGVMEAANLGAYLADAGPDELAEAIDALAVAPSFEDHDRYTSAALQVRAKYAGPGSRREPAGGSEPAVTTARQSGDVLDWARRGGLSVPTWLYGHEPANLFAARIAKYFSNAIREDMILRLARGGIVFATGAAGTVQEVFQATTKTYYATDGPSGPFVFLGRQYWTQDLPVEALLTPLLRDSKSGDLRHLLRITDDPAEAVEIIMDYRTPASAKEAQRTTP